MQLIWVYAKKNVLCQRHSILKIYCDNIFFKNKKFQRKCKSAVEHAISPEAFTS